MKILDKGHKYKLKCNDIKSKCITLKFYKDKNLNGTGYNGTTNQEVLRALIDRIKFLDTQKPHWVNNEILYHLRKALGLHEIRHIERVIDEGYPIELVKIKAKNDHFVPNKSIWSELNETI